MRYGYARVSTVRQGKDGNSLLAAGAQEVIVDHFTGTKLERPAFSQLMARIQPGDTLYITKLDRFARTAADGSLLVQSLVEHGVTVDILNMGRADNTPMGRLMVTVMLAFAEYERDMIIERTQIGKAIARAKGVRVDGRPLKFPPQQMAHAMALLDGGSSYNQVAVMTGTSRSTLIRARNRQRALQVESQRRP